MFKRREQFERKPNPYEKAKIFEKFTFLFLKNLFKIGLKRPIEERDIYSTLNEHKSSKIVEDFQDEWNHERKKKKPNLLFCIFRQHWIVIFLFGTVRALMETTIAVLLPFYVGLLVAYFTPGQTSTTKFQAYTYSIGIMSCILIRILVFKPFDFKVKETIMKIETGLVGLIYRKMLKKSQSYISEDGNSRVINLMTHEMSKFYFLSVWYDMWKGPFETLVLGYFMYCQMGVSACLGFGLILALMPIQILLGRMSLTFSEMWSIESDKRIGVMNEIISGIQVIKMYVWERSFARLADKIRQNELFQLHKLFNIRAAIMSLIIVGPLSILLTILSHLYLGYELHSSQIFSITLIFNYLSISMVQVWPETLRHYSEFIVSIKRIQDYIMENDEKVIKTDMKINHLFKSGRKENLASTDKCLKIDNLTARWSKKDETLGVFDINIVVLPSKPFIIVGPVGCGKSSLLNAIIGELQINSGNIEINGEMSYVSQEPWLFNASIKQNIIFIESLNEKKYHEVCRVCALEYDFQQLPYGDNTIVGENGVVLNDGQKSRISLARAIYKSADIYLLDDPLSVVEGHVGKHIFNECILNYLKEKCVLLITNQIQFTENIDHVVLMESGRIISQGKYDDVNKIYIQKSDIEHARAHEKKALIKQDTLNKPNPDDDDDEKNSENEKSGFDSLKTYIKAAGSTQYTISIVCILLIERLFISFQNYFLSEYLNWEESQMMKNKTDTIDNNSNLTSTRQKYIISYILLTLVVALLISLRHFSFYAFILKASINLHDQLFKGVIQASMRFFHKNSSKRILNRFSESIFTIDDGVSHSLNDSSIFILEFISIIITIAIINSWLLLPAFVMIILFYLIRNVFIKTSRCLTRLKSVAHSQMLTHINVTAQGISTIRAFKAERFMEEELQKQQDYYTTIKFTCFGSNSAFGFWLDIVNISYSSIVILSFLVFQSDNQTFMSGSVGLAISLALYLLGFCEWGLNGLSSLGNDLLPVERVKEYASIESESDMESVEKLPSTWPEHGEIEFDNVSYKYYEEEDFVLKNLTFSIKPEEKIGIVSRSGANKSSSIIQALFRLAESDGCIKIDNINIRSIALHDLRQQIAIIPQNPILFSGTIRKNLDPFGEKTDKEILNALEQVQLETFIKSLPNALEYNLSDDGDVNFSMEQRQLIYLARAILRHNKILIFDATTTDTDLENEKLIQTTIRLAFSKCTVITIAHRLETVLDCDRILVMDAGEMVEFDHANVLLENVNGIFRKMMKPAGLISEIENPPHALDDEIIEKIIPEKIAITENPISKRELQIEENEVSPDTHDSTTTDTKKINSSLSFFVPL